MAFGTGHAPDLGRLRAPVGLALGGRTPAEIAVSVLAELLADRHGGDGAPMSVVSQALGRLRGEPGVPREQDELDEPEAAG